MPNYTKDSFDKLRDYINSRKEIDTHQDEEISRLEKKIDDNEVNFEIYYDMLSIQKGKQS